MVPALVTWDGGAGTLNWADANNWSTDTLPSSNDDVQIPDLPASVTIALNTSPTIKSLDDREGLSIASGYSLSITTGSSQVLGDFSLTGALFAQGLTTTFNAPVTTTADSAYVSAYNGANISLGGITSATNLILYTRGTDSTISLPALTTITSNYSAAGTYPVLNAASNSTIHLPNLTAIAYVGEPYYLGDIGIGGANAVLDVPKLADLSGIDYINVESGANLSLPLVTSWITPSSNHWADTFMQAWGENSALSFPNLATVESRYNSVFFNAYESSRINLPALTTAKTNGGSIKFDARNVWSDGTGGTIQVPVLATADNLRFNVSGDGSIQIPHATSANNSYFRIDGSGSNLTMGNVTSVVGSQFDLYNAANASYPAISNADGLYVYASAGSKLILDGVTSATNLQIRAMGYNSNVTLPSLTTITSNFLAARNISVIAAQENGTIHLPNLTAISIPIFDGAAPIITSLGDISMSGTNAVLDIPKLADLSGIDFIQVDSGANLTLPLITSYESQTMNPMSIYAFGANSRVSFPNLVALESGFYMTNFMASDGSLIDMPALKSAVRIAFTISGNSSISMANITSLPNSRLSLEGGAKASYPTISNVNGVFFAAAAGSKLNLDGVTTATDMSITSDGENSNISLASLMKIAVNNVYGDFVTLDQFLVMNNGSLHLPKLASITSVNTPYYLGNIYISGSNSVLDVPKLADLSGIDSISVDSGANLTLPFITGLEGSSSSKSIYAVGTNSTVSFPNLSVLETRNPGASIFLEAYDGGLIDLPALITAGNHVTFYSFSNGVSFQFSRSETTFNGGLLYLLNESEVKGNLRLINGASISGRGLINGDVINSGSISPYAYENQYPFPAILTIQGNYTQSSDGILNIDLGGATPGTGYDQLNVTGTANLSGKLNVNNYFSPTIGSTFNVVSAGLVENDFQVTSLPAYSNGVLLTKSTSPTAITINAIDLPVINIADTFNIEGDSSGPSYNMAFVISGNAPAGGTTINYSTTGGNAGIDYIATNGSFTVPAGAYSQTINVPIIGNQLLQGNRTFQLQASATSVASVTGTGLIYEDDAPVSITLTSSTAQTPVYNAFSPSPSVTVKNANGHVVQGATVSFTAGTAADGSSATFAGDAEIATALSDASGLATAPTLTANSKVGGPYTLTINGLAYNGSVASSDSMQLSNQVSEVTSIVVFAGSGQSATVNNAFAQPLKVKALDAGGNAVVGVTVTFAVPAFGASGNFAGEVITAVTGLDGVAESPVFTANTATGSYSVQASVSGLSPVNFNLTNLAGAAAHLYYDSGGSQSTKINTEFSSPLKSYVTDTYGNPVAGLQVTFNAPSSGPSVTFAGGMNTAVTGSDGIATSTIITANSVGGAYLVTASSAGLKDTPSFSLNNNPGLPSSLSIESGNDQITTVTSRYSIPLTVKVKDSYGNAVPGVTVTFVVPEIGASGTFMDSNTTAVSDANGIATTSTFVANTVAGAFSILATVTGLSPVTFNLRNTAGPAANINIFSGNNQAAFMTQAFVSPLVVRVTDTYGNPVEGTTVKFTLPNSGASASFLGGVNTAISDANGIATSAGLTANDQGGNYTVIASGADLSLKYFSLSNTSPSVTTFVVQKGSIGRSFVRYVDLGFNTSATLTNIVKSINTANPRIRMTNTGLDGSQRINYNLAGKIAAIDAVLAMDFGIQGIGGDRNEETGDGSYLVELDLDGNGSFETTRRFFRLLGDVNGDKVVDTLDAKLVATNNGATGSNLPFDVNGDGVVNSNDIVISRRQKNRQIKI